MTSTIKVNNIQNQCGANIINENSNTITIGASGDTIALASGASQSGFGREGSVDWQTGSIKTTTFTATSGEGYFVDTSSGAVTANLPAGTAGAIVAFADYTRTFNNNNLTITPNGSNKIGGVAQDAKLTVNGQSATFVFVDSTEGWINVQETQTSQTGTPPFIVATGGTITNTPTCRIHTFTGPGTFQVCSAAGTCGPTRNLVSYLVVAGGGGGGGSTSSGVGGGGAGGYREVVSPNSPYTGSPLQGYPNSDNRVTVTATNFPITVGAGGATSLPHPTPTPGTSGSKGSSSIFSTITSAGGGGGVNFPAPCRPAISNGGSGGGSAGPGQSAGTGNTPPVTPAQGTNGSTGTFGGPHYTGGGGGGASEAGQPGPGSAGGRGGAGTPSQITGSAVSYAGGGGGGIVADGGSPTSLPAGAASPCGTGGAGGGPTNDPGTAGTTNRGGGGGGAGGYPQVAAGGAGGSGVVIIRYKIA